MIHKILPWVNRRSKADVSEVFFHTDLNNWRCVSGEETFSAVFSENVLHNTFYSDTYFSSKVTTGLSALSFPCCD